MYPSIMLRRSVPILGLLFLLLHCLPFLSVRSDQDYYSLLGVSRSDNKRTITKAYRKLALKWHPDKNPGNEKAQQMFVKVANAYEVLNDEEKRAIYDRYGEEGIKQGMGRGGGGGSPFHDPIDIFEQFGFGGGSRHQAEKKGHDIHIPITVSLEEFYTGTTIDVDVSKQYVCDKCSGTGAKSKSHISQCSGCRGRGFKTYRQMLAPGVYTSMQQVCDECDGEGKKITVKCPTCDGGKVVRGNSIHTVTIEPGVLPLAQLVYEHEADQSPGVTPGDLVFQLVQVPNSKFHREGPNLYTTLHLNLMEALVGFERQLVHLDGHVVELKRTGITNPGLVDVVENQGMPIYQTPTIMGKLYVKYLVVFPDKLADDVTVSRYAGGVACTYIDPEPQIEPRTNFYN